MQPSVSAKVFLAAAALVAVSLIVTGIMLVRPPSEMKLVKLDQKRVQDLRYFQQAINSYHKAKNELPSALSDLTVRDERVKLRRDPESGVPYLYRKKAERKYELCASFSLSNLDGNSGLYGFDWRHEAGVYCYDLAVKSKKDG